ncbi:MAG TPA: PEP-CTERM sorting domain-containing protein [Candidatus Omnitrophota bacterium]|nr:PEP-CTERM sorting domain-containing protein [Candidatus Omnitrophota bacterium]HSA30496.1 PEP-CTERM sorting domain-containing protein [Candidatus Omnitrophota bacterium]
MKKGIILTVVLTVTLILASDAFALTWFWGTDPNVTYTDIAESGAYRVWLPFTVISDGDELAGGQSNGYPLLNGEYSPAVRIDYNMGSYWGVYSGTTLIPMGLGLANAPGYDILPDGIYTSNSDPQLNYWSVDDPNHTRLLGALSLNSYRVTIGDVTAPNAVPEPATMLLFSTGLAGAFLRKKNK